MYIFPLLMNDWLVYVALYRGLCHKDLHIWTITGYLSLYFSCWTSTHWHIWIIRVEPTTSWVTVNLPKALKENIYNNNKNTNYKTDIVHNYSSMCVRGWQISSVTDGQRKKYKSSFKESLVSRKWRMQLRVLTSATVTSRFIWRK